MKLLLIAFILVTTGGFAQTPNAKNLEDQKVLSNNQIDAAISRIEESRPCVSKATSPEELRNCERKLKQDLKTMSMETKETRKEIRKFHKNKSI